MTETSGTGLPVDFHYSTKRKEPQRNPEALFRQPENPALHLSIRFVFVHQNPRHDLGHDFAIFNVNCEFRSLFPHCGDGELYVFINVAFQKASAILRAETFFRHQVDSGIGDLE